MENNPTTVQWLLNKHPELGMLGHDIIEQAIQMEREQLISFGEFTSGFKREYNPSVGKHLWYGVISGKHSGMTDDALIEHYLKK